MLQCRILWDWVYEPANAPPDRAVCDACVEVLLYCSNYVSPRRLSMLGSDQEGGKGGLSSPQRAYNQSYHLVVKHTGMYPCFPDVVSPETERCCPPANRLTQHRRERRNKTSRFQQILHIYVVDVQRKPLRTHASIRNSGMVPGCTQTRYRDTWMIVFSSARSSVLYCTQNTPLTVISRVLKLRMVLRQP